MSCWSARKGVKDVGREDVRWSRSGFGARFQDRVGPLGRIQGRSDSWKDWKSRGPGSVQSEEEEMEGLQVPKFMKSCQAKEGCLLHGQVEQPKTKGLKL